MGEGKKTRQELEEQKKVAKEVRQAFDKTSRELRNGYSEQVRQVLDESDKYRGSVSSTVIGKRLRSFLEKKGARPSEFFRKELKNMPGWLPDALLEDFYVSVDSIIKCQVSESYYRRTMRTKRYTTFLDRYFRILKAYHEMGIYQADIVSLYKEELPADKLCFYRNKCATAGYSAVSEYWIAAELDRGNEELVQLLLDVLLGEGTQTKLTTSMLRGIFMSENTELYEAVGKLLLAARLQEGLRQSICENMDYGTAQAFMTLFRVIKENDLLRYSSVMRAVATWTGLIASEESKIDRIQKKQLLSIDTYLHDEKARKEALAGEDAMQIYLALWSYGFFDLDEACAVMNKLALTGSRHQRMVFGMYIKSMNLGMVYTHKVAKTFIRQFSEEMDTITVMLPSFMPDFVSYMNELVYEEGKRYSGVLREKTYAEVEKYFDSRQECQEIYDILEDILARIPKKRLEIDPCVFPWNAEYLDRSDVIMRLAICASALRDEDKITHIAEMLQEIDISHYSRDTLLLLLVREPANDRQREILVDAVADKETYTRQKAAKLVSAMELSKADYERLEGMLKYKKSDIRETVLSILYKLDGAEMEQMIGRLLTDAKEEKRTAGLDILLQLKNDAKRQNLFTACAGYMDEMEQKGIKASTKEQILIREIRNETADKAGAAQGYGLYDVNADYTPVFDEDYLAECKEVYNRYFPDSGIATGKLVGSAGKLAGTFLKMKDRILNGAKAGITDPGEILRKLDALIDAHKYDEYENRNGEICMLGEQPGIYVAADDESIILEDLWLGFYEKTIQTPEVCMQAYVYLQGYNNDKEDFKKYCESFVADLFGRQYTGERVSLGYIAHIRAVISYLYQKFVPDSDERKLAVAVADYLLSRKEDLIYTFRGKKRRNNFIEETEEQETLCHRSVLTHEQIMILAGRISPAHSGGGKVPDAGSAEAVYKEEIFVRLFPYNYALAKAHDFRIPADVINEPGYHYWVHSWNIMEIPSLSTYIAAHNHGLISRDYMYKMAFEGNPLDKSLECVSNVMQYITEHDRQRQVRGYEWKWGWAERKRMDSVKQILLHAPSEELSEKDQTCLEIAKQLYTDMSALVMEAELTRGDTETEFSPYVYGLKRVYGAAYFVRILAALGKETLERSTYFSGSYTYGRRQKVSKKNSLSHLLQVCMPDVNDNADTLRSCLNGTDISEARLIEAAMYAPEWIDIVGAYLGWDGFTAGCYYFMAHMNEMFDDKRKAMIARYTPLEVDELNAGAFDKKWFTEVYEKLGDQRFQLIYKAAKYISDGAKHTRARKYADAALGKYEEEKLFAEIEAKRNKDLLMAVGILPIEKEAQIKDRYLFLQKFKKESKQFGAQRRASEAAAVETAMRNMAVSAGYQDVTRLILRMEGLVAQEMAEFFKPHEVGELSIWLEMEEGGKCAVICEKNGRQLKSVPAKSKKDPYVLELTDAKKQLTEQARRTKAMLEAAMESQETYAYSEIKGMLENPVVHDMVAALVFKTEDDILGFAAEDAFYVPAEDGELQSMQLADDAKMIVAHPFQMYTAGKWHMLQKYVFDHQIIQPFKQVFRELYVKTEEELNMEHSLRYAGNQIQTKKTLGCLKARHWVADIEDGLQKVYYKENIVARIYALADWFSPSDIEAPTLEWVVFTDRKTGKDLKLKEIPDILFSEVMRDVDMAVSVAHAGGVDPETSHSTVEMRKAIAEFTMPLFRLTNVTFTKNHAVIEGKRANYTVHLGSGVVHQEAGPMINVLPVHSQRRGRIFLPFVDDDPKTAEVLTKILFFAEDEKIKDPYILEQIQ